MTLSTPLRGFTLVPVVLAMSVVAAVAFLLNRDNGFNARMITQQADMERARYAAEAGLQAANSVIQAAGCAGAYPISSAPVTNNNFGGAAYSAYSTSASGSPVALVSTATYNSASVALTRTNVHVYQPPANITVQPGPASGHDTFLNVGQSRNFGGDARLRLQTGQYQPLLKFDLSSFPAGTRVVPWYDTANAKLQPGAVLSLYQYDISSASSGLLTLNAQLITRSWLAGTRAGGGTPDGATWATYDGVNAWPSPGMGYAPAPVASRPYAGVIGWVDWDLTNAVAGWMSGVYPNYGIWLVEAGGSIGNTAYVSSNDNPSPTLHPKLTLNYLKPCGSSQTAYIDLAADAYLNRSEKTRNFGGALVMDVNSGSAEQRVLLHFDVSSIPPGAIVQSAKLRLYCSTITSPTDNQKTINAYYVMQSWVEGTMTGSGTANGATWSTRDGQSNWSSAGGYAYWSYILGTAREEASGIAPLPGAFRQGWVTFDLTFITQAWVDGAYANYGILMRSETSSDVIEFDSRQSTGGRTPQLVVVYQ